MILMLLFVYEYFSSRCLIAEVPWSLRQEGWTMLSALLADLSSCHGVQTATLVDPALRATTSWPNSVCASPGMHDDDEIKLFDHFVSWADSTILIAPEFADLLGQRSQRVEQLGGRLLGPASAAIRLTADKLALAHHWERLAVPTPATQLACEGEPGPPFMPCVLKPRTGAGSQATYLIRAGADWGPALVQARNEGWHGELIVQPYVPGRAASVALLIGPGRCQALPPAEQTLSSDGRFRYLGGRLPLPPDLARRAERLATLAVQGIEGLRGYIGVDLVLGKASDGSEDRVIEINPRLTTSYVGLRVLSRGNLAAALLAVATGAAPPELAWHRGPVQFRSDGEIVAPA
jgi:predicted ATP-grasp superfamily ATP-dependent carboligase